MPEPFADAGKTLAMTEERLAYFRWLGEGKPGASIQADDMADAVGEIDRLRAEVAARGAENDRLRAALADIAYNTSTSIPFAAPPETYIVGQLHSCIGRAARALNPEPAS